MNKRLLIFHRVIAPYRISVFNDLSKAFDTRICLQYRNLLSQKFDYSKIEARLNFSPIYLKELFRIGNRVFNTGYWKHLKDFDPDIVIVSEFGIDCIFALLYKWFKRKKYKIISICDDSYNMVAEQNDFSHLHRILRQIIVPKIDDLILVEPKVTEWYLQYYGKGFYFPIIKDDDEARMEYARVLPMSRMTAEGYQLTGKRVFLFVGRLVALKNVETIIKAFAAINSNDTALIIVGDGIERKNLEVAAKATGKNIIFTGRLEGDELYQWYNIANVFVLASYQEPFGAVTNEALLAGCKCLISCKAGSQCLIENGKNGYTFQPMDAKELTELMKKLAHESPETTYGYIRPSQMLQRYDEMRDKLIAFLNSK